MKFFLSLLTCACVALLVVLAGCTSFSPTSRGTGPMATPQKNVAQKPAGYQPSYPQNQTGNNGYAQNNLGARPQSQPVPPLLPIPPASAASSSGNMQGKIKVALLLPLSGRNAALGQAMLNAAEQAVFDAATNNFALQPRDTAGDSGAEGAARQAVQDGAQLIIGPLFAADIPDVRRVAESAGIQILPLSTDTSFADRGVYVMGLAPTAQVDRVVSYAATHGAKHFAALVPDNAYGLLVGQAFQNAAMQTGGVVLDYETYDPAAHNSDARVKVLAAQRDQIDALFLPESGNDLKPIADQLTAAGFNPAHVHVLGTGLWDVPGLGGQSLLLNGAWYAAPDPALRRNFVATYTQTYGKEPPRLATLAYDATALAAVLAKRGGRFDDAALANPNGFAGLDGIFRLLPSGAVERGLAVNRVTADQAAVIDPAPTSFVGKN